MPDDTFEVSIVEETIDVTITDGGAATWGLIAGTITNQSDLINYIASQKRYSIPDKSTDTAITVDSSNINSVIQIENAEVVAITLDSTDLVRGDWTYIVNTGANAFTVGGGDFKVPGESGNWIVQNIERQASAALKLVYMGSDLWWAKFEGDFDVETV